MGGRELAIEYGYKTRPSTLLNSLFMSTVSTAARTLVSVASNIKTEQSQKWRPRDHLRFMVMLMTWMTVWVLRVLMDHLPSPSSLSPQFLLSGFSSFGSFLALPPPPSSSSSSSMAVVSNYGSLILEEDSDGPSINALGRSLTHILALLNEIPATSRKYQFAMAMADNIMDGNLRDGHLQLLEVNRTALSSAFARTSGLLQSSLQKSRRPDDYGAWASRLLRALPLGSYIASSVKGLNLCIEAVRQTVGSIREQLERRQLPEMDEGGVVAEKLAQELLWLTTKLRVYGAVDEAMVHWSYASSLASLSLTANTRVQALLLKTSAIIIGDLPRSDVEVSEQVKFRLLVLWIPLFCHANNGVAYPVLTSFEKLEVERAIDEVMATLPAMEQEVVLTNWIRDFSVSASEWPNLQLSYDRWCHSTRQLVL